MKKSSATISLAFDARRANLAQAIALLVLLSFLTGMFTGSTDEMVAYMLITAACAVPCIVWISAGARGIPLLPPISVMFYVYYALPILRHNANLIDFEPSEILDAAGTVTLFIVSATVPWALVVRTNIISHSNSAELLSGRRQIQIVFFGLVSGLIFYVALYAGWLSWLGPSFGLVRSMMLTVPHGGLFFARPCPRSGFTSRHDLAIAVTCLSIIVFLSIGLVCFWWAD